MTEEQWILEAAGFLSDYMDWQLALRYAKSLYDHYVIECEDYDCDPEYAVREDMTYWD